MITATLIILVFVALAAGYRIGYVAGRDDHDGKEPPVGL